MPPIPGDASSAGGPWLMVAPTAILAIVSIGMTLAAGPLYAFSERAAADLLDPSAYRHVVLDSP
jgi:multicomponent Na+:H+ antiporter subunit D